MDTTDPTPQPLHGICPRCSHFKTCKSPCKPIENFLKKSGGRRVYEVNDSVRPPGNREIQQSQFILSKTFKEGIVKEEHLREFSTANDSAFSTGNPVEKSQTQVFILKIYSQMTYDQISDLLHVPRARVRKLWEHAQASLHEAIQILEKGGRVLTAEEIKERHKLSTQYSEVIKNYQRMREQHKANAKEFNRLKAAERARKRRQAQ